MRRRAAAGRQQARRLQAAGLRRPRPRLERQVRSGSQPLSQDGPRRWHRCVPPARLQAGSHLVVRRRWRTVPHGCPRSVHCPLWQAASPADPTAADHGREWARCPLGSARRGRIWPCGIRGERCRTVAPVVSARLAGGRIRPRASRAPLKLRTAAVALPPPGGTSRRAAGAACGRGRIRP